VLTALCIGLLVLLALLAIPIGLIYRLRWHGSLQGELHVHWLFGLLHLRIPVDAKSTSATTKKTRSKHTRPRRTKAKRKANPLAAWRIRPFRQRILKFVRALWRAIHKREVYLQLQIGLDDPADTGQLWALMGPLSAVLAQSQAVQIDIEPDFSESHLEFNSSGDIRIIPLQLLALTLALLLSPPFWYGMQQMRKAG
jgi:hypothetical protein